MKNLPMDCLRSFSTVAELKGFTQAGQMLGRTQPAISLQVKKLEDIVGAPVFIRGGQQLDLTPTGERLLDFTRRILALNDEVLAELAELLAVGAGDTLQVEVLEGARPVRSIQITRLVDELIGPSGFTRDEMIQLLGMIGELHRRGDAGQAAAGDHRPDR